MIKYKTHVDNISNNFPELRLDLMKETEFEQFTNKEFATSLISSCIDLCEKATKKLHIDLNFAVKFPKSFNATAQVKNQKGAIIFERGLIEKLERIIANSINLFMNENFANLSIQDNQKNILKNIIRDCCISYLFNHELAHILQLLKKGTMENRNIQEKYLNSNYTPFNILNHIYEFDSDLFGSTMSSYELIKNLRVYESQLKSIDLFNSLTSLLFTIANIMIEFSGDNFEEIYFKKYKHPHPFIRIITCNEQILYFLSKNLTIENEIYLAVIQRVSNMISQISYADNKRLQYKTFLNDNISNITTYRNEIEALNEQYRELTRFNLDKICKSLIE